MGSIAALGSVQWWRICPGSSLRKCWLPAGRDFISHKTGRGYQLPISWCWKVPFRIRIRSYQNLNKVHDLVLSGLVIRKWKRLEIF